VSAAAQQIMEEPCPAPTNSNSDEEWEPMDMKLQAPQKCRVSTCKRHYPNPSNWVHMSSVDRLIKSINCGLLPKVLIIMRGLPGCGKSTTAKKIVNSVGTGCIYSTDDFFTRGFEPLKLGEAHDWNQKRAERSLKAGHSPVIIDNTNVKEWEATPYVVMGITNNYHIRILEPSTSWAFDVNALAKRNVHGVPKDKLEKMKGNYEKLEEEGLVRQLVAQKSLQNKYKPLKPLNWVDIAEECEQELDYLFRDTTRTTVNNEPQVAIPKKSTSDCLFYGNSFESSVASPVKVEETEIRRPSRRNAANLGFGTHEHHDTGLTPSVDSSGSKSSLECAEMLKIPEHKRNVEKLSEFFPTKRFSDLADFYLMCGMKLDYCADLLFDGNEDRILPQASVAPNQGRVQDSPVFSGAFLGETSNSTGSTSSPNESSYDNESVGAASLDPVDSCDSFSSSDRLAGSSTNDVLPPGDLDLFVPTDGEDWFDLVLPGSFINAAARAYSGCDEIKDELNKNPGLSKIRIPPNLAFKLFRYLQLNMMQHLKATEMDHLGGQDPGEGHTFKQQQDSFSPSLLEHPEEEGDQDRLDPKLIAAIIELEESSKDEENRYVVRFFTFTTSMVS